MSELNRKTIETEIDGVKLTLPILYRGGHLPPLFFLHGFGSTKEDYADVARYDRFDDHAFIAYDAPGCGESICSDLDAISIPFLVKAARKVLSAFAVEQFHLAGHSMGGLTALQLAIETPSLPLSFIDIEGNVAPEDCFLSRQIIDYPADNPEEFFDLFIKRTEETPSFSHRLYGVSLRYKVRAGAVGGIFRSMAQLSDSGNLMESFINLPFPKMFVYGEQNRTLSYLSKLEENGVTLAEIPHSAHFPMYANPPAFWDAIGQFLAGAQNAR